MKNILLIALFSFACLIVVKATSLERTPSSPTPTIHLKIGEALPFSKPNRIGINLGKWGPEGTQQFGHNILMNPGFEGQIDRILVIVSHADFNSFSDEAGWGYPDGTWNQAAFHILSGKSADKAGVIIRSLNSGKEGFPQYFTKDPLPPLEPYDLVAITKINRPEPPNFWKSLTTPFSHITVDPFINPPKSIGTQSVKLLPGIKGTVEIETYFDTLGKRAGKLLHPSNKWRFSFWAKGETENEKLRAYFGRLNSSSPFFDQVFTLSSEWQEFVIDFYPKDLGDPNLLKLNLSTSLSAHPVWVDDLFLGPNMPNTSSFRNEIALLLKELRPSYLREFAPLGDSWENRIASPLERKTWLLRYSAGRSEPVYNYSLPEFLQLCEETGANPWLIVPPIFSDYECHQMGKYLAQFASSNRFPDIIIEFGYENWNWTYRPTEIPYPQIQSRRAKKVFDIIKKAAGKEVNIKAFVNGPSQSIEEAFKLLQAIPSADGLAISPYFFYSLNRSTPDEEVLNLLFQENGEVMNRFAEEAFSRDRRLAISEINLHTTLGSAKGYERNRAVAGAASGSALAKQLLIGLLDGIDPILVYTLSQYDTIAPEAQDFVDLWGIVRDFGPPSRLRPTGLAIQLLNLAIEGDIYSVEVTVAGQKSEEKSKLGGEEITSQQSDQNKELASKLTLAAFKSDKKWSFIAVSSLSYPITLELTFPDSEIPLPSKQFFLEAVSPFDTNEEDKDQVIIAERILETVENSKRTLKITVPAWGLSVLK